MLSLHEKLIHVFFKLHSFNLKTDFTVVKNFSAVN